MAPSIAKKLRKNDDVCKIEPTPSIPRVINAASQMKHTAQA
jgi:hypothetical protein